MDLGSIILKSLGGMAEGAVTKQLEIPAGDLPKIAADMRARLVTNQADPSLHNLTDAQCASLVKAADEAIITYVEHRLGL